MRSRVELEGHYVETPRSFTTRTRKLCPNCHNRHRKTESLGWLALAREAKGLPKEARKTLAAAQECTPDNPFLEEVTEFLDDPGQQFLPRN